MNIEDYNIHDWNFLEYNFSRCLQKCAGRVNFTLDRWLSTKTFCVPYICLQLQLFSAQRFLRRWKCNFKTSIRRCQGKQGSSWRGNIIIKHHSFFWYIHLALIPKSLINQSYCRRSYAQSFKSYCFSCTLF